jgi:hypothetical protein
MRLPGPSVKIWNDSKLTFGFLFAQILIFFCAQAPLRKTLRRSRALQ